jgi:hypothetical protein
MRRLLITVIAYARALPPHSEATAVWALMRLELSHFATSRRIRGCFRQVLVWPLGSRNSRIPGILNRPPESLNKFPKFLNATDSCCSQG